MTRLNFQLLQQILDILIEQRMDKEPSKTIPDDEVISGFPGFHNELIAALKIIDRPDEASRIEKAVLLR